MAIDKAEKQAYHLYQRIIPRLFSPGQIPVDPELAQIILQYPQTQVAQKSRFLRGILKMIDLSLESFLANSFSTGIQSLKKNSLMDIFNKNKNDFLQYYEQYSQKSRKSFLEFEQILSDLFEYENFYQVAFRLDFSGIPRVDDPNPMVQLKEISLGILFSNQAGKGYF